MMPSHGHVCMALAGHQATIVFAVLQTEALQFVLWGLRVSFRQFVIFRGYVRGGWNRWGIGALQVG